MAYGPRANPEYSSKTYRLNREVAVKRDYGLCQYCLHVRGRVTAFDEVDHIVNLAKGKPDHSVDNLQCLCRACHDTKSKREAHGRIGFPPRLDAKTGLYIEDAQERIIAARGRDIEDVLGEIQARYFARLNTNDKEK